MAWDIQADRPLSPAFEPSMGGLLPFSITPVNGENAWLVTDTTAGFSIHNLAPLNVEHHVLTKDRQLLSQWWMLYA
jgi:hypothetical protein